MSTIMCRIAGGGKALKGDAQPADVIKGKTFSNKKDNKWVGTLEDLGAIVDAISWVRSGDATYIRAPQGARRVNADSGYPELKVADSLYGSSEYSTYGTNRYNQGVTDADNRANTNSTNYKTGYNKGVSDADGRANANSANYKAGYNAGVSAGKTIRTVKLGSTTGYAQFNISSYISHQYVLYGQVTTFYGNCNTPRKGSDTEHRVLAWGHSGNGGNVSCWTSGNNACFQVNHFSWTDGEPSGDDGTWHTLNAYASVDCYIAYSAG